LFLEFCGGTKKWLEKNPLKFLPFKIFFGGGGV